MHANEVAILPYYIANLNIEYTYREKTGQYLEFPNLVFVDTLDNLDWKGGTGGAVVRQGAFELGGLSFDNWYRMQGQNEKTISVILGIRRITRIKPTSMSSTQIALIRR